MKVIFLDIDGVLNRVLWNDMHTEKRSKDGDVDIEKVKLLADIIQKTKAKIVLHSGWRLCFTDKLQPTCDEMQYFIQVLKQHQLQLLDKTPDLTTAEIRHTKRFSLVKAEEITAWLQAHTNVTQYVVLDDFPLPGLLNQANFVRTSAAVGLTQQDAAKAIAILNAQLQS